MELWYKKHKAIVWLISVIAGVSAFAFTNIPSNKSVDDRINAVDARVSSIKDAQKESHQEVMKRLDVIETDIKDLLKRK